MSVPAYPSYRDSGVEWIGQLPSSWAAEPLKAAYSIVGGATPKSEVADYWDGGVPWVTPGDLSKLTTPFIGETIRTISEEGLASCAASRVPSGSVILSTRAPIGSVGITTEPATTNQGCKALVPRRGANSKFLAYTLSAATTALNVRGKGTTFLELSGDELGRFKVPAPSTADQAAIAAFLDHETAKIDELVEEQRRLVELLKEKRQAVISHAVTRGLDPTVPMKDSGVEWLGEVPAHWEVTALKRFVASLDGRRIPLSSEERSHRQGPYPYYGASGIIDAIDDFLFDEELVLVAEDGANLLSRSTPIAFVACGRYWVNNHAHVLRPLGGGAAFWAERIEAIDLSPFVTGAAQPKLTADALLNLVVAAPPTSQERRKIEDALLRCKASVEPLIAETSAAITLLQERRSALISAAVTGKIDVRGLVPTEAEAA